MLLYTIIPYEEIFKQPNELKYETRQIDGGFVELIRSEEGYTVSRLISTNPAMFLKREMTPGEMFAEPKSKSKNH